MSRNAALNADGKEEKRRVMWFKTPNRIFQQNLSTSEKLVFVYLCRCGNNAIAFPSYETIGKMCSISRRSAIRAIKALEKNGFIKVQSIYGKSNIYTIRDEK